LWRLGNRAPGSWPPHGDVATRSRSPTTTIRDPVHTAPRRLNGSVPNSVCVYGVAGAVQSTPLVERTTRPAPPTATNSAPVQTTSFSVKLVTAVRAVQLTPSADVSTVPAAPTTTISPLPATALRSVFVVPVVRS